MNSPHYLLKQYDKKYASSIDHHHISSHTKTVSNSYTSNAQNHQQQTT
jgi:hypothetical protein